jgi:hypothetical protein
VARKGVRENGIGNRDQAGERIESSVRLELGKHGRE